MKNISIRNRTTNAVIFSGSFKSMRHAVETAVSQKISLSCADLRRARLDNATLDGGDFTNASLENASLTGANLSEADLSHANLRSTDLTTTCLCESRLIDTDFTNASFAATLISGAVIDNCIFSCTSAFSLPFIEARTGRNIFELDSKVALFSGPPVVLMGLPKRIAILDTTVVIGDRMYPRSEMPANFMAELRAICLRAVA
ncbi:MAG: pentapeptide repeat-containing protein [Proteobacteria bacterium]|nr:pentapeptide repeat-containing protein [Pseudomonadota bacterium]